MLLRSVRFWRVPQRITESVFSVRNIALSSGKWAGVPNSDHIYKKFWKKHELIEYLNDNVYYEDDDYVVVSKPYGVLSRIDKTRELKGEGPSCESTLRDVLSDLSPRFNAENLSIIVNPERLFSGVTILSKGKDNKGAILNNFESINEHNRVYSYLAVVLGKPPATLEEPVRMIYCKEGNTYDISEDKKKGQKVCYKHEVLASSSGACLVKVDLDYNYLHCLRLVLSTKCFSPVLGDFIYSARVATLFGVPLLVPPHESQNKKIADQEILNLLQLNSEDFDCCPCHIHLYSTTFRVKARKFVVAVPPPEYFLWTSERLGFRGVQQFFRKVDRCYEAETHSRIQRL